MFTHHTYKCKYCPALDSLITDAKEGNITCSACGAVQEERIIDEQFESRNIKEENGGNQGVARLGGPIDYEYFNCLSNQVVIVSKKNKNLNKKIFSKDSAKESLLKRFFRLTDEVASLFNLQKIVVDKAKPILKKILDTKNIGKKNELYYVCLVLRKICQNENIPLTLNNFSEKLKIEKPKLTKLCFKILPTLMPSETTSSLTKFQANCNIMYMNCYIPSLTSEIKSKISEIGEFVIKEGLLEGKNPQTLISAVFYLAGKLYGVKEIKLENLSKASGVTAATIKNSFNILVEAKQRFPEKFHSLFNESMKEDIY